MRSLKTPLLAAAATLVAIAALAGPASASASVWLHNGEPLAKHVELPLRGGEVIQVPAGAFHCNAEATLSTEGGSTAQITAYNIELETCEGLLGEFNECQVTAATVNNLPWSVTVNAEDLTVKKVGISYSFDEACPIHKVESSLPEVTVTLEEPSAIRLLQFGQEGTGKVDGEEGFLIDSGFLQLSEEDSGQYGIG
ncbi:MAG TPA: hypothetical protein VGI17_16305 [Solirubrobacterales bacterium]|jgi:hypothetical protein